MKHPAMTGALLTCALFVALTGCAADTGKNLAAPESAAATVDPNADPLDRLEDAPFKDEVPPEQVLEQLGFRQADLKQEWEAAGRTYEEPVYINLGADQEGVDLTGAFRTVQQVVWVGAERDTVFHGSNLDAVRGYIKDIEHFVSSSSAGTYMDQTDEALAYLEARKADTSADLPEGTAYSYKLHPGTIAQGGTVATDADKAAWPEYAEPAENGDPIVWLSVPDQYGEKTRIPVKPEAETKVVDFNIFGVYDAPAEQDTTHAVDVYSTVIFLTELADGRPVEMHLSMKHQVGLEGDTWKVQSNDWNVDIINGMSSWTD